MLWFENSENGSAGTYPCGDASALQVFYEALGALTRRVYSRHEYLILLAWTTRRKLKEVLAEGCIVRLVEDDIY
jgi:hypothetical protein